MSTPSRVMVLYREKLLDPGELDALQAVASKDPDRVMLSSSRIDVRLGDLVVARHAAWPWPVELDRDIQRLGGHVLNPARAYHYANSPMEWGYDLGDLTPQTWDRFEALPDGCAFILKGEKADKRKWARMYADDRESAIRLRSELQADLAFADQTLVARQYVPLVRLGENIGGVPISLEYRVFVLDGQELTRAFYWPIDDCVAPPPPPTIIPDAFLREAMGRIGDRIRFYALDVAQDINGRWWVIELNDGQRSGLSENSPFTLWRCLIDRLKAEMA